MSNTIDNLPETWALATLDDVYTITLGQSPSSETYNYDQNGLPFFQGKAEFGKFYPSVQKWCSKPKKIAYKNDVLLSVRAPVGPVNLSPGKVAIGRGLTALHAPINFPYLYLFYYLQFIQNEWEDSATGSTFSAITGDVIKSRNFPLAPLNEQKRIVAKIESLFSKLDAAEAALKRAQTNLKRYKASVLKAACEGRLVPTEAELAAKENRDYEPANVLLERILAERRAKWEADEWEKLVVKARKKTVQKARKKAGLPAKLTDIPEEEWINLTEEKYRPALPKNDRWKEKYKEPAAPNLEELPELPEGWAWATVEQLGDVNTGATPLRSNSDYWSDGSIPWIKSGALNSDKVYEAEEFITEKAIEETNVKLIPSSSLLVAMYGEGKTRGKVSELVIPAGVNQAIAAISFSEPAIHVKEFVKLFFQKNYDDIRRLSSGGVQPNLNLSLIKETIVPLPPVEEQKRIVENVESKLSVQSQIQKDMTLSNEKIMKTRSAILMKAFEGKLVPQDQTDEPASELLERIKKEGKHG